MRLDGWESRLWAVVEAARARPYELGTHDCFRVSCQVLEALTGADRWPEFAGRYRTRRQALAMLARHGSSFEAAFDWFFGCPNVRTAQARRGDILALQGADGEKHLGICLGAQGAFLTTAGLHFVPTLTCLCCWRID